MTWQPIDTVPKNGTNVILWDGAYYIVLAQWFSIFGGYWSYQGIDMDNDFPFKYWMPMPALEE